MLRLSRGLGLDRLGSYGTDGSNELRLARGLGLDRLVLCHSLILGYADFSLQRASSIFIYQSTPRCVSLTSADEARMRL